MLLCAAVVSGCAGNAAPAETSEQPRGERDAQAYAAAIAAFVDEGRGLVSPVPHVYVLDDAVAGAGWGTETDPAANPIGPLVQQRVARELAGRVEVDWVAEQEQALRPPRRPDRPTCLVVRGADMFLTLAPVAEVEDGVEVVLSASGNEFRRHDCVTGWLTGYLLERDGQGWTVADRTVSGVS